MSKAKLFAQRNVAIDGKHFAENDEVKGVSAEQLKIAERSGWVGPDKTAAASAPADEGAGEDSGEGAGAGKN
ncbi:hypothetical protein FIV32_02325 [Sphingomonadales bacterium 58]|uniref:hypothetical protein n=1 Tax=Sphingobium sp. S8 TaxID=2758385 RepID=UPI0019190FD2|nr:hypothetical protein [Sphingobium sp. S8]MBY2957586.1 hypothetical protein [Sphingomonadales bacterium 58]CAD7335379.1 hypothetical protein SPHS8_00478 [Sphingobium sp. S8]